MSQKEQKTQEEHIWHFGKTEEGRAWLWQRVWVARDAPGPGRGAQGRERYTEGDMGAVEEF